MKYKNFTLDQFQIDAIESMNKNNSVIVSASTGTGKTLTADYIIDKAIQTNKKVFYTAPIKALSNQKYKDFKKEYGEEKVGLLTGDVTINADAEIIVMTTEIYRNMLLTNDPIVQTISYIVFDEIHFINDIERGTVWEESIIFSPKHVRFLCLSATIPNAQEFAEWIMSIKEHQVDVVEYNKRAVPLEHLVYEKEAGLTTIKELKEKKDLDKYPDYNYIKGKQKKRRKFSEAATHIDVVKEIKANQLPAIFFTFSRKACEIKGKELAQTESFTNKKEKVRIIQIFNQHISSEIKQMISCRRLRRILPKGIAFHHAGMLPALKEVVEQLFAEGLIKILYATETFAVGINMPAKCVCFNTLQKYDGISFRYLNTKEYFQMAGRAGRRGIDKKGTSISLINKEMDDVNKIENLTSKDVEPIISQFKLSINTVINLLNTYGEEEINVILKSNFDYFLRTKQKKQIRIMASWNNKLKNLKKLGYVEENNKLTWKGAFARFIYSNEILISEIFTTDIKDKLSNTEIILTLASIVYEPRRGKRFFNTKMYNQQSQALVNKLNKNKYLAKNFNFKAINQLAGIIIEWCRGCEFKDLTKQSNLEDGDYIRIFRQIIDFLRQIKKGTHDEELRVKVEECIELIDRDVVKVEF
jgi:superfamily II RNA helicase